MNIEKVGEQIAVLRKSKALTQSELGERLGVSFQAVSKWERGETLPDITLLPDLAKILETTIDFILLGSEKVIEYKGKFTVTDVKKGLNCLKNVGEYLGAENIIYRSAINGINTDHLTFRRHRINNHTVDSVCKRLIHAGSAIEEHIQDLSCCFIRVLRLQDVITTLHEVSPSILLGTDQHTVDLGIVIRLIPADGLILENQKEAPSQRFSGSYILDQPDVILT